MATKTANANGEWATCGWTGGDNQVPAAGDTANLNSKALTLTNATATCDSIIASGATGTLTIAGTSIINAAVTYSGTLTAGMVVVPTGTDLTINGNVSNSSTGYAIVTAGTAALTINGSVTQSGSGTGRGVSHAATGNLIINNGASSAAISTCSASGSRAVAVSGAATVTITGGTGTTNAAAKCSNVGQALNVAAGNATVNGDVYNSYAGGNGANGAIQVTGGTATIDGDMFGSSIPWNPVLYVGGGTVNWTGARTLVDGATLKITMDSGAFNISSLALANSGKFLMFRYAGTFTTTNASIVNQSVDAQAVIFGQTFTVTGPTLPAMGNVLTASGTFGYAGGLLTPTLTLPDAANTWYGSGAYGNPSSPVTPTKRASSITNCTPANVKSGVAIDDVTGIYVRPPMIRGRR